MHKLHIKADAGEQASVLIAADSWRNGAQASLLLGNNSNSIIAEESKGLLFNSEYDYYFTNGRLIIGEKGERNNEINRSALVSVSGSVSMTGLTLSEKEVQQGYILVSTDTEGNAAWQDPSVLAGGLWSENHEQNIYRMSHVGIGTPTPTEALDVNGNFKISGNIIGGHDDWKSLQLLAGNNTDDGAYMLMSSNYNEAASIKLFARGRNGRVELHNDERQIMSIRGDGNAYIGDPDHRSDLFVYGEINAHLVRVKNDIPWWDCVFEEDYQLMPLNTLAEFVNKHHHLPDMPAEEEVQKNGIELAEMNALLLKKVEELTLYVIELKKENEGIREEIDKMKGE